MATLNDFRQQRSQAKTDRDALFAAHAATAPVIQGYRIIVATAEKGNGQVDVNVVIEAPEGKRSLNDLSDTPSSVLRAIADILDKISDWKTGTQPWPFP